MIEATVKKVGGRYQRPYKALEGCRVSLISCDDTFAGRPQCVTVGCILKTKKGSRMRKERYEKRHFCDVVLEDIVSDAYEED